MALLMEAESYGQVATIFVVLRWFVDQAVLSPQTDRRREEAATIQGDSACSAWACPGSGQVVSSGQAA